MSIDFERASDVLDATGNAPDTKTDIAGRAIVFFRLRETHAAIFNFEDPK